MGCMYMCGCGYAAGIAQELKDPHSRVKTLQMKKKNRFRVERESEELTVVI